eukprot:5975022-Prymnesium_polylepis.1
MFPITVAMTDGHASSSCKEMWAEQHSSLGVALSVWEAARAAADPRFSAREAWPLLRGVAEWIGARGAWTAR